MRRAYGTSQGMQGLWFLQQEADCQRRLSAAVTGGPDSCFMSAESQGVREGRPFFYAQARAEETVLS